MSGVANGFDDGVRSWLMERDDEGVGGADGDTFVIIKGGSFSPLFIFLTGLSISIGVLGVDLFVEDPDAKGKNRISTIEVLRCVCQHIN